MMKYYIGLMLAAAALFSLQSAVFAQAEENIILDSADIKLEKRKLISFTREGKPSVKEYGEDWWSVDLTFSTEEEITEEIRVKVYLAGYDALNDDAFVILTGEVTFINVLKGADHRATFYLHPGSAMRFGGEKGIESFGRNSGEHNVRVEIFEKGRLVAEMDMEEALEEPNWFREGAPVPDILLSVEDSPWWPFESLSYSQIKEKR